MIGCFKSLREAIRTGAAKFVESQSELMKASEKPSCTVRTQRSDQDSSRPLLARGRTAISRFYRASVPVGPCEGVIPTSTARGGVAAAAPQVQRPPTAPRGRAPSTAHWQTPGAPDRVVAPAKGTAARLFRPSRPAASPRSVAVGIVVGWPVAGVGAISKRTCTCAVGCPTAAQLRRPVGRRGPALFDPVLCRIYSSGGRLFPPSPCRRAAGSDVAKHAPTQCPQSRVLVVLHGRRPIFPQVPWVSPLPPRPPGSSLSSPAASSPTWPPLRW